MPLCANVLATREVANEVVLLDIKEGFAEGKALDIWETAPINLYDTRTEGSTNDYSKTAESDVVVITSGLPRKPGMSRRDDLIATNAGIVKTVTENVMKHSPDAILVIVSNPLDVMTYCAYLTAKVDSSRVFGMAGILDTARYRAFLAKELNVSPKDIRVDGRSRRHHGAAATPRSVASPRRSSSMWTSSTPLWNARRRVEVKS